MGRGRVELKRIDDKVRRQVSFTKRPNGLMKKAHELSVLCDVDLALFVFSRRNRLYEFSTGHSMTKILNRYLDHKHADEAARESVREEELRLQYTDIWTTADRLTQMIQRQLNEHNVQQSDAVELYQLRKQTEGILHQVRTTKTQLMLASVKNLHEEEEVINYKFIYQTVFPNNCLNRIFEEKNQLKQQKQLMHVGEVTIL